VTRLIFLGLLLLTTLYSGDFIAINTEETKVDSNMPKVLYLNYQDTPKKVIKGAIFTITIKTLATTEDFTDINYTFSNYTGVEILNTTPYRDYSSKYYYDTFYLLATQSSAKTPDITASLVNSSKNYKTTTLTGQKLNVITLNPKSDFSNIIANSFKIVEYRTTSYDKEHNIIVFVATAEKSDIKSINLNNVFKQGVESITESYLDSKITYYAVIDKRIQNFSFSYFNILKNRFVQIHIPIIVDDDSVTTQSDLKPKDQSHEKLKLGIAGGVTLLGIILMFLKKRYIYFMLIILPLAYIAYITTPSKELCIKENSNIYLLPVDNGTIFETTQTKIHLQKEGSVKKFIKVKLTNDKIGWVRNEDICSN
jgi:hypothetical protein